MLKTLTGADGFTVYRDLRAGHAWLFDGTTFWTYDDPAVVLQKALWIRGERPGRRDGLVARRRRRQRHADPDPAPGAVDPLTSDDRSAQMNGRSARRLR